MLTTYHAPLQDLNNPAPLEVNDDVDSAISLLSDGDASTASLSSVNIQRYRHENGRTYHGYKDGKYVIPNDAQEQARLDLQHHLFLLTFDNRLYLCPAGSNGNLAPKRVLDVGTGTGIWAVDYADGFPDCEQVIRVELSPTQSPYVQPNVVFQVDDIERSHDVWWRRQKV